MARIRARLTALSESERAVADWVLTNPSMAVRTSMSRLAELCQVSDTTVLRMSRNVGFAGFTDLKYALVGDLARPEQHDGDHDLPGGIIADQVRGAFQASQEALRDTLELLDIAALERAVKALSEAETVTIVGVGGSKLVTYYLCQRLLGLGRPAYAPPEGHLQLLQAGQASAQDVVIAVSYSGLSTDVATMLASAGARGATTIVITGNPFSPAAQTADILLPSVAEGVAADAAAGVVAQLAIIDAITAVYAATNEPELG